MLPKVELIKVKDYKVWEQTVEPKTSYTVCINPLLEKSPKDGNLYFMEFCEFFVNEAKPVWDWKDPCIISKHIKFPLELIRKAIVDYDASSQ